MRNELIDRTAAAAVLGCSTKTVDRLRRRGNLAWVSVGRTVKFRPQALNEYIAANERNGAGGERPANERQLAPERIVARAGEPSFVPPSLRDRRLRRNGHG